MKPKPSIQIPNPCPVPYADMTPAEGGRLCAQCDKVVINLSAMTREAAEEIVLSTKGKVCVNGMFDPVRGEFLFAPEKKRLPIVPTWATSAAIALAACGDLEATAPETPNPTHHSQPSDPSCDGPASSTPRLPRRRRGTKAPTPVTQQQNPPPSATQQRNPPLPSTQRQTTPTPAPQRQAPRPEDVESPQDRPFELGGEPAFAPPVPQTPSKKRS